MRNNRFLGPILIGVLFVSIVILGLSITIVPAGHVGVKTVFGEVYDEEIPEGLHLVNPLAKVHKMSIKSKESFENAKVPSKKGLEMSLEASLIYRIDPSKASEIYKTVGLNYLDIIVTPNFRSILRGATVKFEAKDLYTADRGLVQSEMFKSLGPVLMERGIIVENILLRDVSLPPSIKKAIESKLRAEQKEQEMDYIIGKEKKEAERKAIEAQGIADFQKTVKEGIDDQFIKWKAIESVNNLAESNNSKFVILGDKTGLPIIVNPDK